MNAEDVISERIGEWQTRLLQLNRRNNLLYFKPGRSAVGITNIALDELDARLGRSRIGLAFPYVTPFRRRRRGFRPPEKQQPAEKPKVSKGDLTTDCEVNDLQRRLGNLRRRYREWKEEQGLNVLFLAMGFLDWTDADGEPARSPLILIPCDLNRPSPRDPYRILSEDDDPVVNPTLRHQLSLLSIELPEFRDEPGKATEPIADYVAEVNQLTRDRDDWSVSSDIFLGVFSYSKLAMYEDLTRMRETGVRNQLTRLLAGGLAASDVAYPTAAGSVPSDKDLPGGRLDDLLDIRDQYTVLPTDFSQLRAIEQARRGGHLVIHGPPGTGKSQTIVNLIATFLADGKRVLFVSEKTAALDVVKRRLEECELGVFCLDLHSDRGRKTRVYNQIRHALKDNRDAAAPPVSTEDLIEHRNRLNRIARLLHKQREPLGKSVYEVQGRFAALNHLPRVEQVQIPPANELTAGWARDVTNTARRIANRPDEFRENDTSCWIPLRAGTTTLQLVDSIREDMGVVMSAIEDFHTAVDPHTERLKLPAIRTAGDTRVVYNILRSLSKAPGVPATWLDRKALPLLRRHAREQKPQQRERRRLEGVLSRWFGAEPPPVDYRAVSKEITLSPSEQELFEETLGPDWRAAIGNPVALSQKTSELQDILDQVLAAVDSVTKWLPGQNLRTLDELDRALALIARVLDLDPVPEQWLAKSDSGELEREFKRVFGYDGGVGNPSIVKGGPP